MTSRRIQEYVHLRYRDFDKVKAIVADANAMLNEHPGIQHDFFVFQMDSYGDYALRLFLYAFTKGTDYNEYMRIKEDILLRIGEIVHKHGAELAVPTSTVHMPEGVNLRRGEAFAEGLVEQPQAT
jgi:MscS family membrane protein